MARFGKQRRAKRKRREREHEQWVKEQADDALDPKGGEFIVLTWPGPEKSKPMKNKNLPSRALMFDGWLP